MITLEGKVLELGGGNNPANPGKWTNMDVRPGPKVDVVADFNQVLPVEDKSYDGIYAAYVIEHVSWRSVKQFIREMDRILKPGGKAVFVTANLKEQARVVASREWGDPTDEFYESRLIFGDLDYPENSHKCGFSPEFAARLFDEAGFRTAVARHPTCATDMIITALKPVLDRFAWVRQQIGTLTEGEEVVDIGCAEAPTTSERKDCIWVDSEPYEKLADAARFFKRTPFPRERFVQASAHDLPFESKRFKVALLTELLEHVAEPVAVLKEAKRIAERLVITVPDEFSWDEKWKPFENVSHVRHYTKTMLERHLQEAGIRNYQLGKLEYEGWSFFTVTAEVGKGKRRRQVRAEATREDGKLKIAFLSAPFITVPPKSYGGMERIVYDLAVPMAAMGHDVTIFGPDGSFAEGCKVVEFGPALGKVHVDWLKAEAEAIRKVRDQLAGNGYQIIHGHNWFGFEYGMKLDRPQLRVCHTHHGGLNREWWCKSKPPFKLNFIAISEWMRQVYASCGIDSRVVYNGIDTGKYQYSDRKGDRLLFVGRVDTFKRPHLAIEIAKRLGMGLDIVAGRFVQDENYMRQIEEACDGKQIRFIAEPPQEEKVRLMQEAKCLLFPSKMAEPFGLCAAEANCCGTPVVASRDGAIGEVVEHGVTGFVCDSVEEMCEAVKKVDRIEPKACRERVERLFSRETAARAYLAAYRDILEGSEW